MNKFCVRARCKRFSDPTYPMGWIGVCVLTGTKNLRVAHVPGIQGTPSKLNLLWSMFMAFNSPLQAMFACHMNWTFFHKARTNSNSHVHRTQLTPSNFRRPHHTTCRLKPSLGLATISDDSHCLPHHFRVRWVKTVKHRKPTCLISTGFAPIFLT